MTSSQSALGIDVKRNSQMLLFRYPLFNHVTPDKAIRILVMGWNEAAIAFVDSALAVGQIPGYALQITVCSQEPDDACLTYVSARPALGEYIDIKFDDGDFSTPENPKTNYGTLRFCQAQTYLDMLENARKIAPSRAPRYVFSVEGEDETRALIERIANVCAQQGCKTPDMLIAAAQEGVPLVWDRGFGMPPMALCADDRRYQLMMDMAFNAHLVWLARGSFDMEAEWASFIDEKNQYNYSSSMTYALSIPYKLWAAGIGFDNLQVAADDFAQKLAEDTDHALLYELMNMEQRRWVMEKVAEGYQSAYKGDGTDAATFEAFIKNASVKLGKMHVCIRHSEASAPLEGEAYQKNHRKNWDTPNENDEKLDELDRMSVELHRFMQGKANALRDSHYSNKSPAMQGIRDAVCDIEKRMEATTGCIVPRPVNRLRTEYNRFVFCVHAILDGSAAYAEQYAAYAQDFMQAIERAHADGHASDAESAQVAGHLAQIRHDLFPAIEANQYRNYKRNNKALVQYIPFVLTYKRLQHLAIPFSFAEQRVSVNDLIFTNVASPVVIKPKLLLYLYHMTPDADLVSFDTTLRSCIAFLRKSKIRCAVHLAISIDPSVPPYKRERCEKNLKQLKTEALIEGFCIDSERESEAYFLESIENHQVTLYDGTTDLFHSRYRQSNWTKQIESCAGYFEMNPATKQFFALDSCRWLRHIHDTSFLRIDDMFALLNCENRDYEYLDCTEYVRMGEDADPEPLFQCLWRIYTGGAMGLPRERSVYLWNTMCSVLDPQNTAKLPSAGRLDSDVGIDFSRLVRARTEDAPSGFVTFRNGGEVRGIAAILRKIGSIATLSGNRLLAIQEDRLHNIEKIIANQENIVKLLSKAGTILEVYCYYRALETGYFDDIASSCTFYWGDREYAESERKNEIDLILTRGFRTMIVECKATASLEQGYFHKLNAISSLLGINARKVLVANAYSSNRRTGINNETQISRGNLMNILTIHKAEHIEEIGTMLKTELMNRR